MSSNFSRRTSARKKQTRLTFDPVAEPSSSSTVMSPARVRYSSMGDRGHATSSSPLRRLDREPREAFSSNRKQNKNATLPFKPSSSATISNYTTSSQTVKDEIANSDTSDSDTVAQPIPRRHKLNKNNPTSSMVTDPATESSAPPSFMHRPISSGARRLLDDSSSEGSPIERDIPDHKNGFAVLAEKARSREGGESPPKKTAGGLSLPDLMEEALKTEQSLKSKNDSRSKSFKSETDVMEESEEDDIHGIFPTPRKRQRSSAQKLPVIVDDDSDEPLRPTRSSQRSKGTPKSSQIQNDEDDSLPPLSQIQASGSAKRRKIRGRGVKSTQQSDDNDSDDVVSSSAAKRHHVINLDDEDDDEEPVVSSPAKRRRRALSEDEDEDGDVVVSSPSKRLRLSNKALGKGKQKATVKEADDSDDSEEISKTKSKRHTRQKQARRPHRTEREKKMELLRRKRAGEKITELTPSGSSNDESDRQGLYDTDSDLQALSEFEDEESDEAAPEDEEEEALERVRRSLIQDPKLRRLNDEGDSDDADFIVEDDLDDPLGIPSDDLANHHHLIPLEFTHQAHKPLKEHFKDAIEWMVQNRLNPRFARTDPIYTRAFTKLDDEVRGYALSKFTSSAWNERFTRALWARPDFFESELTVGEQGLEKRCDACGRSNHPAKYQIWFGGRAYSKETLEVIDDGKDRDADNNAPTTTAGPPDQNTHHSNDDDDEEEEAATSATSSSNSSTASLDSRARPLPRTTHAWRVGRFCKANAETAHSLIHWKHALNEWVANQLNGEGELTAAKLAERQNWPTARAGKYANAVVDRWEMAGTIKGLYRDFKANLEGARVRKMERWG